VRAWVSQGELFRAEAGVAAAAALIVLVAGRRAGFGVALAVAASALGVLLPARSHVVPTAAAADNHRRPQPTRARR
jgi:hypothetical protein